MEEIPPGGRPGPWMQGGGYYSSRTPAKAERVEFSDEQKREVADALHEAEVALLRAITRSADLADTYYMQRAARFALPMLLQPCVLLRARPCHRPPSSQSHRRGSLARKARRTSTSPRTFWRTESARPGHHCSSAVSSSNSCPLVVRRCSRLVCPRCAEDDG
jgi:hypothetical protein